MSAQDMRRAIVSWFAPPAIPGLVRVYPAMPTIADGREWDFGPSRGWAAVGYVHISDQSEQRIALGGAFGGIKQVTYQCGLVLLYRYLVPSPVPVDSDESAWVVALDALLDAVTSRIREDRTFGCGDAGPVWQAGEGDGIQSPDVRITRDLPVLDAGKVHAWQVVEFTAVEMVES